ncbi:MAG: methionyl-tRNA formyltransferase [Bacteroidales bacterium]|nr:methionyl-tRNA formyltransferase [Bacteroidales bacterium]
MKDFRIVFMGTPEFAVSTLGALIMNGYNVTGVVTSPDKPSGRGRKLTRSAVKEFAEFHDLPVIQPDNLKNPEFIEKLKAMNADMFIVVAFRMLPELVWRIPEYGTMNLHASLLPHYRGAAPINHAIINGESSTGVTTFLIDEKIDTGKILLREEVQIFPFENAGDLQKRLMILGARLVIKTLEGLAEKKLNPQPQSSFIKPGEIPKPAPKIFPEDCIINWNNEALQIHNLIRGLAPYPCARSFFRSGDKIISFKIFESLPEIAEHEFSPGSISTDGKNYLKISCKKGFVNIISLQAEGKNRMETQEFLRGFKIESYTIPVS